MSVLLLALGLVLAVEGLFFALMPGRIEDALKLLAGLPVDTRRLLGLGALAAGVALIWLSGLAT